MMFIHAFCVLCFLCEISSKNAIEHTSTVATTNIESVTPKISDDKWIMKCCDIGEVIHKIVFKGKDGGWRRKTLCDKFNGTETKLDADFDDIFIHKPNLMNFNIKPNLFKVNKTFRYQSIDFTEFGFNMYLNEDAEVLLEKPNAYDRLIHVPNHMYCIDSILEQDERDAINKTLKPGLWTFYTEIPDETNRPTTTLMIVGMLVSCFFLVLVLVVYGMLPELRNLCGMILMAYVASLLCAFLMLVVMRIKTHEAPVCEGLTYVIYYFFLASFCWMNVMSYDIWWTFRGYAKARPIHRRGESFKFRMYNLYAFGFPLGMTIMLAVLNNVDLKHVPWFVTPKVASGSCFLEEAEEFLYLYIPMLILILCNWMFYIMTAVNIWRLSRGTAVLDSGAGGSSQARRLNRRRFIIYLKLSVVMGLNWLLELMSFTSAATVIWFISDCYNMLIGVSIFIIFVCKRKIIKKLRQRFASYRKFKWYPTHEDASKSATTTDNSTNVTQEMHTLVSPCITSTTKEPEPKIIIN